MDIVIGTLLLAGGLLGLVWYALTRLGIAMARHFAGVDSQPPSVWYPVASGSAAVLGLLLFF